MARKRGKFGKNKRYKRTVNKSFNLECETLENGEFSMLGYLDNIRKLTQASGGIGDGDPNNVGRPVTRVVYKGVPVNSAPAASDYWESGIEVISHCGTAPDSIPVTIGPIAQAKINALMQEYPRIEWLAYLLGDGYNVTDIVLPKQKVTTVRVDVDPAGVNVPTIGVIHSHHGMGNGFSGTDHEYINQNHNISLCISHGGIAGQVRVQTSCGKYVIVKASISQLVDGFDHNAFVTEAKTLIHPVAYNFTNSPHVSYRGNRANQLGLGEFETGDISSDEDEELLGIDELAIFFREDIESFPLSYETMDLVGMKEIIGEVCRQDRNYEVFKALYTNILDSNAFDENPGSSPQNNPYFNVPIELLDAIDTDFKRISITESMELVKLFKSLKEAIELCKQNDAEVGDNQISLPSLPSEKDLWSSKEEASWNTKEESQTPEKKNEGLWDTDELSGKTDNGQV